MIENIIPIVIALKHKLEELKSPLIDDLMHCLRELMKDYKNEVRKRQVIFCYQIKTPNRFQVKDMLAADKQLAAEIEFDLKKWEEEQKKIEETRKEQQQVRNCGSHLSCVSVLVALLTRSLNQLCVLFSPLLF